MKQHRVTLSFPLLKLRGKTLQIVSVCSAEGTLSGGNITSDYLEALQVSPLAAWQSYITLLTEDLKHARVAPDTSCDVVRTQNQNGLG